MGHVRLAPVYVNLRYLGKSISFNELETASNLLSFKLIGQN